MKTKTSKAKAAPAKPTHKSSYAQPLMLLVDDVEQVHLVMKPLLEFKAGVRVLSATTSDEALQLARKNPKLDLVISDIRRPGLNGIEFLEVFKKERPSVPVIMVSGALSNAVRQRAYRLGAAACYSKPVLFGRVLGVGMRTLLRTHSFDAV
jgi:CheY-like chemotaxis protein